MASVIFSGNNSRNLLVPEDHPDAWIRVRGPWAGLSICRLVAALGDPTTNLPAAEPWRPRASNKEALRRDS